MSCGHISPDESGQLEGWDINRPRIIFFPGLGADHRLLEPQRALNAQIEIPPWIRPRRGESLASYGRRMIQTLDTSTPFFLGGVSFGGFVAQEIARTTSPRGLILISCRSATQLPRFHRTIGMSARITPPVAITVAKLVVARSRRLFGVVNPKQAKVFDDMLFATDSRFMRWCIRALLTWKGVELGPLPVLHIHGAKDRIIPLCNVHPDHVIDGAGHVVNMSHPKEVNVVIEQWLAKTAVAQLQS